MVTSDAGKGCWVHGDSVRVKYDRLVMFEVALDWTW